MKLYIIKLNVLEPIIVIHNTTQASTLLVMQTARATHGESKVSLCNAVEQSSPLPFEYDAKGSLHNK